MYIIDKQNKIIPGFNESPQYEDVLGSRIIGPGSNRGTSRCEWIIK